MQNIETCRKEEDFIGSLDVPSNVYWGIHTERAIRNFPVSGRCVRPSLIRALAMVKKSCALANVELGYIEKEKGSAIVRAFDEIATGMFSDQFVVDALQGGAGTSTNMNLNEVVANRAIELLGGNLGDYSIVHPLEHVNLHQSTNDVYPTGLKVAAILGLRQLSEEIARLQDAFQRKEADLGAVIKIGRTELQEAVPMTLGSEFAAFAEAVSRDRWRTFKGEERLRVVNLGGTAIGTGLTAPRDYIFLVIEKIRDISGIGLSRGENLTGETANADPFVEVSGILKAHASNLIKIAGDLRMLHFIGEIHLPNVQTGSSVMPGKVNPVVMEAVIQTGMRVMANDMIVSDAVSRGTLQINEFMPLIADAFLEEIELLSAVNPMIETQIRGTTADEARCRNFLDRSPMVVTALVPVVGYQKATDLIREFNERNRKVHLTDPLAAGVFNIRSFLEEKLGKDTVDKALSPYQLTALGYRDHGHDTQG